MGYTGYKKIHDGVFPCDTFFYDFFRSLSAMYPSTTRLWTNYLDIVS